MPEVLFQLSVPHVPRNPSRASVREPQPRRLRRDRAGAAAPPSRPSADLLLTTPAIAAGPRAIAVVLSAGHDGATGASAIHAFGGTVVASDEASWSSFGMPRAAIARDDVVDHVVALKDVAALLVSLVGAPTREAPRP
jgi:two-component system, chemotaxis family, protein-glutamate methylesterase/glutaminase